MLLLRRLPDTHPPTSPHLNTHPPTWLQMDYHIPSLTVLETCDFAHACQASLETAAHFMAKLDQVGVVGGQGRGETGEERGAAGAPACRQAALYRVPPYLQNVPVLTANYGPGVPRHRPCPTPAQLSERLEREAALEELGAEEDRAEMGQVRWGSEMRGTPACCALGEAGGAPCC